MNDVERVGGKNASLGEMISNLAGAGVSVPNGFATTAHAYREFLAHENLADRINSALGSLDVEDVNALAKTGTEIRSWIIDTPFQPALDQAIEDAFVTMTTDNAGMRVAVRSSATAEDLPDASFAGSKRRF